MNRNGFAFLCTFVLQMKKATTKSPLAEIAKQASKIKVSKKLNTVADAPFFKKKMENGRKMLAIAGLPK